MRNQITADIHRTSWLMAKQRELEQRMLSTVAELRLEPFLPLEQKDFQTTTGKKMLVGSEQVACLEVEEYLPRRTGEDEDDAL